MNFDYDNALRTRPDERESTRLESIGGQVTETVDLTLMEHIPSDSAGSWNAMEVTAIQSSCRAKLPLVITNEINWEGAGADKRFYVHISKNGQLIVLISTTEKDGYEIGKMKSSMHIGGLNLSGALASRKITLPARYIVTKDDKIGGFICRKDKQQA